jgi:hypothetical protein
MDGPTQAGSRSMVLGALKFFAKMFMIFRLGTPGLYNQNSC